MYSAWSSDTAQPIIVAGATAESCVAVGPVQDHGAGPYSRRAGHVKGMCPSSRRRQFGSHPQSAERGAFEPQPATILPGNLPGEREAKAGPLDSLIQPNAALPEQRQVFVCNAWTVIFHRDPQQRPAFS